MIYDKIENIPNYLGLSKNLDRAFECIKNINLNEIKYGRNDIDGDNLYLMLFEYETKDDEEVQYESHKNYIDIQMLVEGDEYFRYSANIGQKSVGEYSKESDIEFFELTVGNHFHLNPDNFILVFPGELHAPALFYKEKKSVKKLVFKIKM